MAHAREIDATFERQNPDWSSLTAAQREAIYCREQVHLIVGAYRGRKQVNDRITSPDDRMCREIALYRTHHRQALRTMRGAA